MEELFPPAHPFLPPSHEGTQTVFISAKTRRRQGAQPDLVLPPSHEGTQITDYPWLSYQLSAFGYRLSAVGVRQTVTHPGG